jgi:hypothetical protein
MKILSSHVQKFKIGFEKKCIRLFVEAYKQSIKDKVIHIGLIENDITEILRMYMDKNFQKDKWKIHLSRDFVISDPNISQVKGFSNTLKKVDLIMEIYDTYKFTCSIEAKRLKENDYELKRRYIDTGIDSFITKKYPYGFLVGYLLEGTVFPTVDGINKLLKKDGREGESLYGKKHEIAQYYFESNHSELCLKHLIFDFTVL